MKLLIETKSEAFVRDFVPEILKEFIIKNYSSAKAQKMNWYLQSLNLSYSVRTALLHIVSHLKVTVEGKAFGLEVDKNVMFTPPGLSADTIARLIEHGIADIKGYPLLSDAFKYVNRRISSIKKLYIAKYEKRGD